MRGIGTAYKMLTLKPGHKLILAGFWLALVILSFWVTPARPVMFLLLGLAAGVIGGALQWRAFDVASAESRAEKPHGDIHLWTTTSWGKAYRIFFWLFLAVLLLLAFGFQYAFEMRYVGLIVGYSGYALMRELVTLAKVWQIRAGRGNET